MSTRTRSRKAVASKSGKLVIKLGGRKYKAGTHRPAHPTARKLHVATPASVRAIRHRLAISTAEANEARKILSKIGID
jgi:hypothetical protein